MPGQDKPESHINMTPRGCQENATWDSLPCVGLIYELDSNLQAFAGDFVGMEFMVTKRAIPPTANRKAQVIGAKEVRNVPAFFAIHELNENKFLF